MFTLHGYFNRSSTIDLHFLENSFSTAESRKILKSIPSTNDIIKFQKNFRFSEGEKFDIQHKKCIELLKSTYNVSGEEAEGYYYPRAIESVYKLAIESDISNRKTTKISFIKTIDKSRELFNLFLLHYKGKIAYINGLRNAFRNSRAIDPAKHKFIILGKEMTTSFTRQTILTIKNLCNDHYQPGSSRSSAYPLTIVIDNVEKYIFKIKRELIMNNIFFNDGYESYKCFSPSIFDQDPIKNINKGSGTTITKASYVVRIISYNCFKKYYAKINKPDTIFDFTGKADLKDDDLDLYFISINNAEEIYTLLKK